MLRALADELSRLAKSAGIKHEKWAVMDVPSRLCRSKRAGPYLPSTSWLACLKQFVAASPALSCCERVAYAALRRRNKSHEAETEQRERAGHSDQNRLEIARIVHRSPLPAPSGFVPSDCGL